MPQHQGKLGGSPQLWRCPRSVPLSRVNAQRRRLAAALFAACAALDARSAGAPVQVWVDLTEPPRRTERVARQQQAVAAELQRLGATELARVRHTGNAIAVQIDPALLDQVRALHGVRGVRPAVKLRPPRTSP